MLRVLRIDTNGLRCVATRLCFDTTRLRCVAKIQSSHPTQKSSAEIQMDFSGALKTLFICDGCEGMSGYPMHRPVDCFAADAQVAQAVGTAEILPCVYVKAA